MRRVCAWTKILALSMFFIALIVISVTAFVTAAAPTASPTAPTAAKLPRATFNVDTAAARLVIQYPVAPGATLEATHRAIANAEATWAVGVVLAATQHPYQRSANAFPTYPVEPSPTVETGIINDIAPLIHHYVYIQNRWQGVEGNQITVVYAGVLESDLNQGVVLVSQDKLDSTYTYRAPKEIRTPTKHGSVKITAVNGTLLTLEAKDDTGFTFDVSTLAFV